MKCANCGAENGPGQRFCSMCGQPLAPPVGQVQTLYQYPQMVVPWLPPAHGGGLWASRVFSGIAWLLVSVGTFIAGFGYLGVIDSAYSFQGSSQSSLDLIGFAILIYAVAAIFVALNRFVKDH